MWRWLATRKLAAAYAEPIKIGKWTAAWESFPSMRTVIPAESHLLQVAEAAKDLAEAA